MEGFFTNLICVRDWALKDFMDGYIHCLHEANKHIACKAREVILSSIDAGNELEDVIVDGQSNIIIMRKPDGEFIIHYFILVYEDAIMHKIPLHYMLRALEYGNMVYEAHFHAFNYVWEECSGFYTYYGGLYDDIRNHIIEELEAL